MYKLISSKRRIVAGILIILFAILLYAAVVRNAFDNKGTVANSKNNNEELCQAQGQNDISMDELNDLRYVPDDGYRYFEEGKVNIPQKIIEEISDNPKGISVLCNGETIQKYIYKNESIVVQLDMAGEYSLWLEQEDGESINISSLVATTFLPLLSRVKSFKRFFSSLLLIRASLKLPSSILYIFLVCKPFNLSSFSLIIPFE